MNLFILGHGVVIYFIMQSLLEKQQKLTSQREKLPSVILFCQSESALLLVSRPNDTHSSGVNSRNSYYAREDIMSIPSVVRHFLLLNQLRAGDIFTSYSNLWIFRYLTCSRLVLRYLSLDHSLPGIFRTFSTLVVSLSRCFSQLSVSLPLIIHSPLAFISDF